jgi:putative glutamine amidotransferase
MRKNNFIILLLLLVFPGCATDRSEIPAQGEFSDAKHVVIMHPTVGNIETWLYLTSEGILPVAPGTRVLGVYSHQGAYDYSRTAEYILEQGIGNVTLMGIEAPFDPQDIFAENENTGIFNRIFNMAHGIIFFGGPDIPPSLYGQEMNILSVVTDPHRHYLELSFLYHLLGGYQSDDFVPLMEQNPNLPVLGLCLGMQTMNVAAGGTMIQDIPSEIYGKTTVEQIVNMDQDMQHRNYYSFYRTDPDIAARSFHRILIEDGSHMAAINGGNDLSPYVLSSHHQAVDLIGRGFRVTAWSMDRKVAEAIEHEKYPNVIGVQFHPEVSSLFIDDSMIKFKPGEEAVHSFTSLYPGPLGVDFHRSFWNYFGRFFPETGE